MRRARGYDLAVSTIETADYTASFRVALVERSGILCIDGGFRKRIEIPEQHKYAIKRMLAERNTAHGIKKALHGQAFVQDLHRVSSLVGVSLKPIKDETDKFTRALPSPPALKTAKSPSSAALGTTLIQEACTFPFAHHDDQIDAVSIAVRVLSKAGMYQAGSDPRRSSCYSFLWFRADPCVAWLRSKIEPQNIRIGTEKIRR